MDGKAKITILGSGQDGGVPHAGCHCPSCARARNDYTFRRLAPSIAVYDEGAAFCYVIDASFDFATQVDMLRHRIDRVARGGKIPVSAILLTHAHVGHYAGLLTLGVEVLNARELPIYCTPSMKEFLSLSRPFSLLVENSNVLLHEIEPGRGFMLDGVEFTPLAVPHRGEITDTVGYGIGAERQALYIPDTDRWSDRIIEQIGKSDIALIDGTFYSKDEIPRFGDVPHPPIEETLDLLKDVDTEIYFTHINHTNPVNTMGPEREHVEQRGFMVAYDGLVLPI